jgi:hypothetical protein
MHTRMIRTLIGAAVLSALPLAVLAQDAPPAPPAGGRGAGAQGGGGRGGGRGAAPAKPAGPVRRMPDGKPDIQGFWNSAPGGANYGLSRRTGGGGMPGTQGVIVDPPDGLLPMQEWARAEQKNRELPERGYDDPTAHCFVAGVPRSMYVPAPFHILQPPGYVVFLHERMSYRVIPLDGRKHIPDSIRLWQGDSVGRWEGDTLVIETRNLNGKTWLNEVGEVISHAATVVERYTPVDADTITYEATVTDPVVYTRPWTIRFPVRRQPDELLEIACHEDNQDLIHLKEIKEEAIKAGKLKPAN